MHHKISAIFLAVSLFARILAVAPNQMAADFNDGIQKGNLKLALGWSQENHEPYRAQLLQGQFEFFATDYFGVRGNAALPLSLAAPGMQYYPLTLGMALHFLPRHAVDFFAGADAGFVYFGTSQLRANWSTRITAIAGMSLYFWGAFFLEAEAGYSVLQYARDTAADLSAPTYRVRIGFYL
ncbi:MAG: hypothetical protein NZL89_02925 [Leptospiraceae bacterium]|nr:hypothetical protein [Leptospiraceae bacterium]MDW8307515.1 hypothetical protein [Leptospiraceae bacterium]